MCESQRIVALDLSLSSTGVARWDPAEAAEPITQTIEPSFRMPKIMTADARLRRLHDLHAQILGAIGPVDLALIEGYSYASKVGGERLGELGGVIRLSLYAAGVKIVEIAPPAVKKYATGNGAAAKPKVHGAAVHRAGREFATMDESDAWWLLQMALAHYGLPHVPMPATHRAVLDKIAWPILTGVSV